MKKLKTVAVIGHFGEGLNLLNGQTVKTKIQTREIEEEFGENEVVKYDTHGKFAIIKAPFYAFSALKKAKNVLIFPAHNGVRVYVPLLVFLRRFFPKRKLHYSIVGGWLPKLLEKKKGLLKTLKRFDGLYAETETLKQKLGALGLDNVSVVPNCKNLEILAKDELVYQSGEPLKLCTFSRVMKEKGIEDAANAVKAVNEKAGRIIYTLDIYGQVDSGEKEWFENLENGFPEYVKYKGEVGYDKSTEVLKNYFALLFPTRFYTEGIPGTIIDAYAAGIPVISAKWESFSDMVDEGVTGFGYEMGDVSGLARQLVAMAEDPETLNKMKSDCLKKSRDFTPQSALKNLIGNLI